MKIGILGGSFDPIHNGHLYIAEKAKELLGLDFVIFIPAACPPHKIGLQASNEDRFYMTKTATENHNSFICSDIELNRTGKSYTADTLSELHKQYPKSEFYLIVGADMANDIKNWRRYDEIAKLAAPVTFMRNGYDICNEDITILNSELIDISSTEIRRRVKNNEDISGLVPEQVAKYIKERGIYR